MLAPCGIRVNAQERSSSEDRSGVRKKFIAATAKTTLRRQVQRWLAKSLAGEQVVFFLCVSISLALDRCDHPLDAKLDLAVCPGLVDVVERP